MRYFTNNPLERLMMQKPKAAREDSPPDAAKEHFCYGCKRFGQSCVRPCYRDVKRMEATPAWADGAARPNLPKIGRASCRERV